jgi:hypothetical protein
MKVRQARAPEQKMLPLLLALLLLLHEMPHCWLLLRMLLLSARPLLLLHCHALQCVLAPAS